MKRGDWLQLIGIVGMGTMILCLESTMFVPALILALVFFGLIVVGYLINNEPFIEDEEVKKPVRKFRKVRRRSDEDLDEKRDKLFSVWINHGSIK